MASKAIFEILGPITQSRYLIEALKADLINEMQMGYRPTIRGEPWSKEMFDALDEAAHHVEATFNLLKGLQFPTTLQARQKEISDFSENGTVQVGSSPPKG